MSEELKKDKISLLKNSIKRLRQNRKDDLEEIRECRRCIWELEKELKP